jgi:hypothetical protein
MTEEEYKCLEVIYNRGSILEQPYINYLNGFLAHTVDDKDQYIQGLFSKFRDNGFIDGSGKGIYRITALGREKFEAAADRKEFAHKMERLSGPKRRVHLGGRFWLALIILVVIVSILTSMILNKWEYLSEVVRKIMP